MIWYVALASVQWHCPTVVELLGKYAICTRNRVCIERRVRLIIGNPTHRYGVTERRIKRKVLLEPYGP